MVPAENPISLNRVTPSWGYPLRAYYSVVRAGVVVEKTQGWITQLATTVSVYFASVRISSNHQRINES